MKIECQFIVYPKFNMYSDLGTHKYSLGAYYS